MKFQRFACHVCEGQVEQKRQKRLRNVKMGLLGCYLDTPVVNFLACVWRQNLPSFRAEVRKVREPLAKNP